MTDEQIVNLYWQRDEAALRESESAYGAYCRALAERFVSAEDASECVNDAYLRAWDAIPPERPTHLRAFLARLTRNAARYGMTESSVKVTLFRARTKLRIYLEKEGYL